MLIVDRLLAKNPTELVVLCSSVGAVIGPGQIDYSSTNAFLDEYARQANLTGVSHVVPVDWAAWQDVGMAVAAAQ